MEVFTEQLLELHRGQGMEIYWRDNFICPSETQYKETIVKSKFFINSELFKCFIFTRRPFFSLSSTKLLLSWLTETGGLFMLGIRLLQLFSDYQSDLKNLVSLMGLYFQVRDDYANLMLAEVSSSFPLNSSRMKILSGLMFAQL